MKPKAFRRLKVFGLLIPVFKMVGLMDQESMYGYYESEAKYIGVDSKLKGVTLEHTVIHEMFHSVLDRLHIQHQLDEKFVEIIVENLTLALIDNYKVQYKK